MKTLFNRNTAIATFAATVIVALAGFTLDRGHDGALPRGIIEVGSPTRLAVGATLVASLPAVEVVGSREVTLADAAKHADPQG